MKNEINWNEEYRKNHDAYNKLILRRIKDLTHKTKNPMSSEEFSRLELDLERRGVLIRKKLNLGHKAIGDVFCNECGRFFYNPKHSVLNYDDCEKHKGQHGHDHVG